MKKKYTNAFRSEVVAFAKSASVVRASRKFDVPLGTIFGWMAREKKEGKLDLLERSAQRSPRNIVAKVPLKKDNIVFTKRAVYRESGEKETFSRLLALADKIYL